MRNFKIILINISAETVTKVQKYFMPDIEIKTNPDETVYEHFRKKNNNIVIIGTQKKILEIKRKPNQKTYIIQIVENEEADLNTKNLNPDDFIFQPFTIKELIIRIKKALAYLNLQPISKNIEQNISNTELQHQKNKIKCLFLENINHEIRTPLNAIIGFSEMIMNKVQEPEIIEYLKGINNGSRNLLNLIEDLIDLSRYEAGQFKIELQPVSIKKITDEITEIYNPEIRRKKLNFRIITHESVPCKLLLDYRRIRQILINLVGNAVKFTPNGSVSLTVKSINSSPKDKITLILEVRDTGIGIKKELLNVIFNPFINNTISEQKSGVGLGLPLVQRLVEAMHGEINVESHIGIGSIFKIKLQDVEIFDNPKNIKQEKQVSNKDNTGKFPKEQNEKNIKINSELSQKTIKEIIEIIRPTYIKAKDSMFLEDLIEFANKIIHLGQKINEKEIEQYGKELHKNISNYEISKIIKELNKFSEFMKKTND